MTRVLHIGYCSRKKAIAVGARARAIDLYDSRRHNAFRIRVTELKAPLRDIWIASGVHGLVNAGAMLTCYDYALTEDAAPALIEKMAAQARMITGTAACRAVVYAADKPDATDDLYLKTTLAPWRLLGVPVTIEKLAV